MTNSQYRNGFRDGFASALNYPPLGDAVHPATPSDKQEAIYQIDNGGGIWADVDAKAYEAAYSGAKRIVYAATPAQSAEQDRIDAKKWRAFKSFAHHSYNQKVMSNAHSASLMKEHLITVHAASWDELESHIDAVIAKGTSK